MLHKFRSSNILRRTACLLFPLCVFAGFLWTQTVSSNSARLEQDLNQHFVQHQTVKLDAAAVTAQVRATGRLSLATTDLSFDLELTPHDMRGAGYRAEEFGADGRVRQIDTGPVHTFRGQAHGAERGVALTQIGQARFTIDERGIEGLIITPAEHYFVEPARKYSKAASAADYVIYKESDVVADSSGSCGLTLSEQVNQRAEAVRENPQGITQTTQSSPQVYNVAPSVAADEGQNPANADATRSTNSKLGVWNDNLPWQAKADLEKAAGQTTPPKIGKAGPTSAATGCAAEAISSGQQLNRTLAAGCAFQGGQLTDIFSFSGEAGQQVAITMTSTAFDTHLYLYFGPPDALSFAGQDDNGAGGTNSRIPAGSGAFTLPATATYYIYATSVLPNQTGNYTIGFASTAAPAPANDNFANAQVISGSGTVLGSNIGATKETGEPNHAGLAGGTSVWYRWQAPNNNIVTFDTLGSNFDTMLGVYTGASVGSLTTIAGNEDAAGGQQSSATFFASSGTTYYIAVDGSDAATGSIKLTLTPAPANDNFGNAQIISGGSGNVTGSNAGAGSQGGEPVHANVNGGKSVWYRWQAPGSGSVSFTTTGSDFDTLLAVYTGSNEVSLTEVVSNDDDSNSLQSRVTFNASAGTVYQIAVDGYQGAAGNITLNWSPSSNIPTPTPTPAPSPIPTPNPPPGPLQELRVATEADHEYVLAAGAGVPDAAEADRKILSIMNQVEGLYEVQLGLTLKVAYQSAWSTPNDPYSSTNPSALLGELTDYWNANRGSVARDVVHMWTGKNLDNATVGTAYLEALCRYSGNGRAAFGLSKGVAGAQQIAITAHEIGHNLGATHPNQQVPPVAECSNTVMSSSVSTNPRLDFCQYSVNEIAKYLSASTSCLGVGTPPLNFATARNYSVQDNARSVAAGDFNGDGKKDLAVSGFGIVSVLLGTDNDSFKPAVYYLVNRSPASITLGDFNADGNQDLVVAATLDSPDFDNKSSEYYAGVLLGNGDGSFQAVVYYPAGQTAFTDSASSVAVGDFDGDSKQDLAIAAGSRIRVMRGTGTGSFEAAVNYPAGVSPRSLAVSDFDGDGDQDLAVANAGDPFSGGSSLSVLRNSGNGSFEAPVSYLMDTTYVAVGDFNNDEKPDLAVTSWRNNTVSILLGTGTGSFGAAVNYPVGSGPEGVTVGDFNGDRRQDLAVANSFGDSTSVLLGTETGTFQAALNYSVGFGPWSLAAGDFNGDLKQDLAVVNYNNVSLLLGTGTGGFDVAINLARGVGSSLTGVKVGDFNGDGKPDLAVANSSALDVLIGVGNGAFEPTKSFPIGAPTSIAFGDFNADGKQDIACAFSGSVKVLLGDGAGNFQAATTYSDPFQFAPQSIAVADFNGDGRDDLTVADYYTNNVGMWLSTVTGSLERVKSYSFGPILSGFGLNSLASGDFNGDGKADIAATGERVDRMEVLLGTGSGRFEAGFSYSCSLPQYVAMGDFNRDGKQDLALATGPGVTVLLGLGNGTFQFAGNFSTVENPQFLEIADFNADGKQDIAVLTFLGLKILQGNGSGGFIPSVTTFATARNARSSAAGDFNQDGKTDLVVAGSDVNLLLNISGNSVASPPNDNFASTRVISGPTGTIGGTTVLATKEANEPNHASNSNGTGGASIWYRWPAPSTGKFYFQTFSSSFASVLAVYTGSNVSVLSPVAVSSSSVPEYVEFNATVGTVYQIAIDGVNGDTGRTVLNWNTGSLSNDNFAFARQIRGGSGSVNGDNTNFTSEPGEPALPGASGAGFSAWYRWTAPNTGRVTFSISPCEPDTTRLLGAYTGNFLDTLVQVAVSYDGFSVDCKTLRFNAVAGVSYSIQMQSNAGRPFTLGWNYANSPPNDNFANALVIAGNSGSVLGTNNAAGKELGEPNHAGNPGGASVWYRWTAPFTGPVTFDTLGMFNFVKSVDLNPYQYLTSLMGVYTGSSLNALTEVAANSTTNTVTFNAVAGTTYQIAVDSARDTNGLYLTSSILPLHWGPKAAANDDFENAQVLSSTISLESVRLGSNVGATRQPGEPNHQGNPGGASVWYRWTALNNGNASFVFPFQPACQKCTLPPGSGLVGIYKGNSVDSLIPVPASTSGNDHVFSAQVGTTYYIAVDGAAGATGTYQFALFSNTTAGRNNAFVDAQQISGSSGAVAGDNSAATKEQGEPDHANDRGGKSVWYKWTAPSSALYTFDTFGSNFDTLLGVYTGNAVGALSLVESSDNGGASVQSRVTFNAIVDTTYYIAIDGKSTGADPTTGVSRGESGFIMLNWNSLPPPVNDNFASAQVIQGAAGNTSGRNTVASKEGGEPAHAGNPGGVSIWYKWTAPGSGLVTFTTLGGDFNSVLAVYTGTALNALTNVVSNDDTGASLQSLVTFNATAGTVYYIAVDGSVGVPGTITAFSGNVGLNWFYGSAAGNDSLTQAQMLTGDSGTLSGTNTGTTKESGEPNHAADRGGRSVWYSWTASFDGPVLFTTLGSDFDTLLAAYTGNNVNNLNPIASNDDSPYADNLESHITTSSISFIASTGTTYKIAVDGSGGRSGNLALRWGPDVSISGQVAFIAGQCGIAHKVTMILSGEDSRSVTFTGSGNYAFQHLRKGGNYSVRGVMEIPANCFPLFLERAQNYFPLAESVVNGDFIDDGLRGGGSTSTIAGQIKNSRGLGIGRSGTHTITVTLSGSAALTSYANSNGTFELSNLPPGSYTVTPSCPSVGFTPAYRNYNFSSNQDILGADFEIQDTYVIEGQARDSNGVGLTGVDVTLSNTAESSTRQTDVDGYYSFTAAAGESYTVTASQPGTTFSPASRSLPGLSANQKNADFIAATSSTPPWQPEVLTAQQIDQLKAWTRDGRTFIYVRPKFPDAGYRIVSWGQATRTGNDFSVDASVEKFSGASIQAVVTTAQIYDLGPLANGTYNFNFKTSGTLSKALQFTVGGPAPPANPMDDARQFVRQQYLDFLNREPDGPGWDFWTDNITKCSDPARRPPSQTEAECISRQRETTSAAFFISPEFQNTGYFVLRVYRGSLARFPYFGGSMPPDFSKDEFTRDHAQVSAGIVVNNQLDPAVINANKQAFVNQFVSRTEFLAIYGSLSNSDFVDRLFQTTAVAPTPAERIALIDGLANGSESKASVLFKIVDGTNTISDGALQFQTRYGQLFYTQQFNPAFVQMEYFGYMKRDPDDAGYAFWLGKLNQYPTFAEAEMVLAFISSPEYRARFGQP